MGEPHDTQSFFEQRIEFGDITFERVRTLDQVDGRNRRLPVLPG